MSTVHAFLSNIPEDVDYERLLKQAWDTFQQYPPSVIAKTGQLNISSRYDVMLPNINIIHYYKILSKPLLVHAIVKEVIVFMAFVDHEIITLVTMKIKKSSIKLKCNWVI